MHEAAVLAPCAFSTIEIRAGPQSRGLGALEAPDRQVPNMRHACSSGLPARLAPPVLV